MGANFPNILEIIMRQLIKRFARDERGANALEYALIMILVAMGVVGGATTLGTDLSTLFSNIGAAVAGVSIPTL